MKTKSYENGVLLFMANRKRIRKTIRMVLKETEREQLKLRRCRKSRTKTATNKKGNS